MSDKRSIALLYQSLLLRHDRPSVRALIRYGRHVLIHTHKHIPLRIHTDTRNIKIIKYKGDVLSV